MNDDMDWLCLVVYVSKYKRGKKNGHPLRTKTKLNFQKTSPKMSKKLKR